MLQPVKNIDEYKRIKQNLRDRFESDRTGEQHLFIEQTKLLQPLIKPLISTQEQTVKAIQAKTEQQSLGRPALTMPGTPLPIRSPLGAQPEEPEVATDEEPIKIDLNSGLDEMDIRNLQDMGFELPSGVFKNIKQIEKTIAKIKTENRRIGQKLGRGSDASPEEKELYKSWKNTLEKYRHKVQGLEGAKQFVGSGVDVIFYPNVEDLCSTLTQLDAAKRAGNTGLDNRINSVLDEMLRIGAVTKNEYDALYKIIFL
jgi:hypothetical protein